MGRNDDGVGRELVPLDTAVASLRSTAQRLQDLNRGQIAGVVERSASPDGMSRAYRALSGAVGAAEGRQALRDALQADGVSVDDLDAIDALYLQCLVSGSMPPETV